MSRGSILLSLLSAVIAAPSLRAQAPVRAAPASTWQEAARSEGLTPVEVERLGRQKILSGQRPLQPSFEGHARSTPPLFITSDSLLEAFGALFQDSFHELETRRGPQLRQHLEGAVSNVRHLLNDPPFPLSDLTPGWRQTQRAIGPAMVLLGTPLGVFDPEVRDDISEQLRLIRTATAVELPAWLAPGTDSVRKLDYRELQPVGFYTASPELRDYFRAVRWLQMVPFRVERDQELTAIALLGYGAQRSGLRPDDTFFESFERFFSPGDGKSIIEAEAYFRDAPWHPDQADWAGALAAQRRSWAARPPGLFRLLKRDRFPDGELFRYFGEHGEPAEGLQVVAALGSSWAQARITPRARDLLATAVRSTREDFNWHGSAIEEGTPVYLEYLSVLGSLLGQADPDAPGFMASDAWAAKSIQCALAGWVQMRASFVPLLARTAGSPLVSRQGPAGFIEPNPDFLRAFAKFLDDTRLKLNEAGLFDQSAGSFAASLDAEAEVVDRLLSQMAARRQGSVRDLPEWSELESFLAQAAPRMLPPSDGAAGDIVRQVAQILRQGTELTQLPIALPTLSAIFRQTAKRYQAGELQPAPQPHGESLLFRWQSLVQTTGRLETLLQKQLRGRPWSEDESMLIADYNATLAVVMGRSGDEAHSPGDAQRWMEIPRHPDGGDALAVAAGRPRALYVLYPWRGGEVFCRGALIPYYEFRSSRALTEQERQEQLAAPPPSARPAWIQANLPES